ncbi:hypothetical protein NH340_JMT04870 [Sarcoptes scabiei]|nr:hypothetical protein NH340_JMT04870 [Sarcoptes scabiei]
MNLFSLAYTLQAILIIMFIFILNYRQQNSKDFENLLKCSRSRSKIIRDGIQEKIAPIFDRYQTKMPIHCPFHAEREFLWHPQSITDQEHQQTSNLICPYCGAKFSDAKILTEHWDQEHRYQHYLKKIKQDPLNENNLICLADYCGIFRCDIIERKMLEEEENFFNLNYFSSFFKTNSINENGDSMISSSDDSLLLAKKSCDLEQMRLLQNICLQVIQQCTIDLKLIDRNQSISVIDSFVLALRKELSDSICSYLNCEDFYNDAIDDKNDASSDNDFRRIFSSLKKRKFTTPKTPIIFFSIVGLTMFIGFSIIYHYLWNVLIKESDDCKSHGQNVCNQSTSSTSLSSHGDDIRRRNNAIRKQPNQLKSDSFFRNIFEFHRKIPSDDDLEDLNDNYNNNDSNIQKEIDLSQSKPRNNLNLMDEMSSNKNSKQFKTKASKIHRQMANCIIEEEEESDLDPNSFPNISRKPVKKAQRLLRPLMKHNSSDSIQKRRRETINELRRFQEEICLDELPMRFHSKFVQPIGRASSLSNYQHRYISTDHLSDSFLSMTENRFGAYSYPREIDLYHESNRRLLKPKQSHNNYVNDNEWFPRVYNQLTQKQLSQQQQQSYHSQPCRQYESSHPIQSFNHFQSVQSINARNYHNPQRNNDSNQFFGGDCYHYDRPPRKSRSAMSSYHVGNPRKRREILSNTRAYSDGWTMS